MRGAFHQLCQSVLRVVVPGLHSSRGRAPGVVPAVTVDEHEPAETLSVERLEQLADDRAYVSARSVGLPGYAAK